MIRLNQRNQSFFQLCSFPLFHLFDSNTDSSIYRDALVYHPGQLYLSQPTPIHLEAPIVAPNAEENDEPLENPEDDEDGSIKVWIGLQKKKGGGQKKVTLKKFETKRLDQYINTKPGHIFNAGGPISGVDWLPRADTTTAYSLFSFLSRSPILY